MRRLSLILALLAVAASCTSEPTGTNPQLALQQATTISADSMTAEGLLTEACPWTLEKTAASSELSLFREDVGTSKFTVTATRGDPFDVYSVAGQACATNTGADPTEGLTITVKVQASVSGGTFEDITGASVTIEPEAQLGPAEVACYDYEVPFDPVTDATYRSVAQFTITNLSGTAPDPLNAAFDAPTSYTGQLNASVNVQDSGGQSWTFDGTGTQEYEGTFTCDDDVGDNDNTATIVETGDEASATVAVVCYALDVTKTAVSEFTRTWVWTLDKTSEVSALTVPAGFPFAVDYTVTPSATFVDGAANVSGTITVTNPAPMAAKVLSVADAAAPDITLDVTCEGATFPVTLATDEKLECTYGGDLPDLSERENVATAELQNVTYDAEGAATETGTTAFTGSEQITFGDPSNNVDTCIDVTDDQGGSLGTVCLGDLPTTFTYSVNWGPFETCGVYSGINIASFTTNDTGATGSDSWTVEVNIPCGPNCTLSQGYWKNHSEHGPAKYDETWAYLANGADTPFFDSGLSWLEMFRTPPKRGNAFFILGHQYAAAWLNGLRGADVSAVAAEIQRAAELLDQYDGNPDGMDLIEGDVRKEFIHIAETLDRFNNGKIGPGSCD